MGYKFPQAYYVLHLWKEKRMRFEYGWVGGRWLGLGLGLGTNLELVTVHYSVWQGPVLLPEYARNDCGYT